MIEQLHFALVELTLATLLAAAGVVHAMTKVTTRAPIRLPHVLVWAVSIIFGLGPWIAFVYGGGQLPHEQTSLILGEYAALYLYVGGIATAGFLVPIALGQFFEGLNPPNGWEPLGYVIQELQRVPRLTVAIVMVAVWVVRLYLIVNYNTLGSVGTSAGSAAIPYSLRILNMLGDFAIYGVIWWAVARLSHQSERRYYPALILASELIYIFPYGRSGFSFTVGLIVLGFIVVHRRAKLKHFIIVSIASLVLLQVLFPLYHAFRLQWKQAVRSGATTGEIDEIAEDVWEQSDREASRAYSSNMSRRPLVGRWICQILAAQRLKRPIGGEVLRLSLLRVVPTAVYPAKSDLMVPRAHINAYYGFAEGDAPNSFPAFVVADFGILACFWIGFVLGLLLLAIEYAVIRLAKSLPLYAGMLAASTVFTLFVPALTYHTVLIQLRSAAILLMFFAAWNLLFRWVRT